jgi:MarR family transcriptional regulator for hemolysin
MRQKDLARSLLVDGSSVVRILDTLESLHLVERREGADRRAKTIHLTPLGQATVQRIEKVAWQIRRRVLAGIPGEDIHKVLGVLTYVCDGLASKTNE